MKQCYVSYRKNDMLKCDIIFIEHVNTYIEKYGNIAILLDGKIHIFLIDCIG